MNVKYKIGDRVRLKTSSEYYPRQSDGKDGTITRWEDKNYEKNYPSGHDVNDDDDDSYYFGIDWDKDTSNCYRICDIEPAVSTVTRISIPEVDSYVKVTDPNWPGVMYVQVTRGFSMDRDGHLRGYGNLITFGKEVKFDSHVSIYCEHENRRFLPMTNREIVWMNYCLYVDNYISYDLWSPSSQHHLMIEVLDRYPNLKVGEKFGFVDGQEVKSIHPREWTVGSDYVYLARSGQGGAMVYKNGVWAARSKYMAGVDPYKEDDSEFISSSWCVACNTTSDDQDELRQWRFSPWCGKGYIDNTGYWTEDKPANKHLISYQTFLDKVYYPSKGMTPPVKQDKLNVNDIVQATNTYSNAAFRIGEVFKVYNIEGEHLSINIDRSERKEPAKYFKKIDLVGKKVEIMKYRLNAADVKEGDVLTIRNVHIDGNFSTNGGWFFPISFINDKSLLVLLDDQKVEKVKMQIHDTSSSTTHLPYLNIGTKEKRSTSFIEHVDEIRVTKKVSKKPKCLTI